MSIFVSLIMLFGVFGLTGCNEDSGKEIEVDGWTLFRYTKSKQVNIISADSEELVVDGVLNIPAKIGKYNTHGFGRYQPLFYGGYEHYFTITGDVEVEHVVLAAELHIDRYFSSSGLKSAKYVEFLSDTFERIERLPWAEDRIFIIPDGSAEIFWLDVKKYQLIQRDVFL